MTTGLKSQSEMIIVPVMPNQIRLQPGVTYKLKYVDEDEYFFGFFVTIDRGFLCFDCAGSMVVCRPEDIQITL